MSDYTTLKGFDNVSDVDIQSTIQQNIINFFDWGFINKGGFTNINLSKNDIRGNDRSVLIPTNDPLYSAGRVWSCFRQNLVWESGLYTSFQPIAISGVYVNGSFKTPTTAGFEHYVDYEGGRVVFQTPQSVKTRVTMEYAYKTLQVTNVQVVPLIKQLQGAVDDISDPNYTAQSGDWQLLSREKLQMPLVTVELSPRVSFTPYEYGATNQFMDMDIILHVLADDQSTAMKYGMFLAAQKDKTIYMYDIGMAASSGVQPLDSRGAKTANAMTYPQLVNDSNDGGYRFNKVFFKNVSVVGPNHVGTIYHTAVRFTLETIAIF